MDLSWINDQALVQRGVFVLGFLIVGFWELAAPGQDAPVERWRRWSANCLFYGVTVFTLLLMGRLGVVAIAGDAAGRGRGLAAVNWLPIGAVWAAWIFAADFMLFAVHRLMHRISWLWHVHRVHHSDAGFDFTTQFRFHPLETVATVGSQALLAWILAPPAAAIFLYEVLRSASGFFGHANASVPARWERWISKIWITPDLHRVHHAIDPSDHDTNYGVLLSIWDRMAGTLRERPGPVATGIEGVSPIDSTRPLHLLLLPFLRR